MNLIIRRNTSPVAIDISLNERQCFEPRIHSPLAVGVPSVALDCTDPILGLIIYQYFVFPGLLHSVQGFSQQPLVGARIWLAEQKRNAEEIGD